MFGLSDQDAYPYAVSLANVAAKWRYPVVMVLRKGALSAAEWADDVVSANSATETYWLNADLFAHLKIDTGPVIAFVREGRLVDAVMGLATPSSIRAYFALVAEPIGSTLRDTWDLEGSRDGAQVTNR